MSVVLYWDMNVVWIRVHVVWAHVHVVCVHVVWAHVHVVLCWIVIYCPMCLPFFSSSFCSISLFSFPFPSPFIPYPLSFHPLSFIPSHSFPLIHPLSFIPSHSFPLIHSLYFPPIYFHTGQGHCGGSMGTARSNHVRHGYAWWSMGTGARRYTRCAGIGVGRGCGGRWNKGKVYDAKHVFICVYFVPLRCLHQPQSPPHTTTTTITTDPCCTPWPGGRMRWHTQQKGIVRYNCADSLDRTNAASYFGAVQALAEQCRRLGLQVDVTRGGGGPKRVGMCWGEDGVWGDDGVWGCWRVGMMVWEVLRKSGQKVHTCMCLCVYLCVLREREMHVGNAMYTSHTTHCIPPTYTHIHQGLR